MAGKNIKWVARGKPDPVIRCGWFGLEVHCSLNHEKSEKGLKVFPIGKVDPGFLRYDFHIFSPLFFVVLLRDKNKIKTKIKRNVKNLYSHI